MIDLPVALIGGSLLAAGLVLALSLRLDPEVRPGDRRRRRTAAGGIEITHDHDGDDAGGGRDA